MDCNTFPLRSCCQSTNLFSKSWKGKMPIVNRFFFVSTRNTPLGTRAGKGIGGSIFPSKSKPIVDLKSTEAYKSDYSLHRSEHHKYWYTHRDLAQARQSDAGKSHSYQITYKALNNFPKACTGQRPPYIRT